MLNKFLAIAVMVCVMPAMALAASWTLNSQVPSPGGSMASRNKSVQTSTNPSLFGTYTTHTMAPISVTANPGYTISSFTVNNNAVTGCAGNTACSTSNLIGAVSQTVTVKFAASVFKETASANIGGTVSPASYSNIYYGAQSPGQVFTFVPLANQALSSIVGTNSGFVCSTNGGGAYSACAAPYGTGVTVKVKVTNVTGNVAITGTFAGPPIAKVGAPQTVMPGTLVTLDGSASSGNITSYTWTQTTGPATVALTQPVSTTKATVIPTVAGTYNFNLTVQPGGSVASTYVTVTNSIAQVVKNACVVCHTANGVGTTPTNVYANWSSSKHKTSLVVCATCHVGTDTGGHPGATVTSAACESCHTTTLSTTTHPADLTASKCITCHDSHNPAAEIPALEASDHPAVTLYTFEEIGMQMAGGQKVPVQVDANGKGMPYSPKQTCGTAGCHVLNGVDYTYDKISDHAFHSNQGRSEYQDSSTGKFDATKNKPWVQSAAMVGKW